MKEKARIIIISIVAVIALLSTSYFFFGKKIKNTTAPIVELVTLNEDKIAEISIPEVKEVLVRRYLDGVYVPEGQENNYPVAVMIDNHKNARPASGIASSSLVIEAEAEGGVTRYFAVFATHENIPEIGPVRSARPYFVDWAEELAAVYAHVGGSPDALEKIINDRVYDMNEFFRGSYFWRDHSRLAPHNVYISTDNLHKYLDKIELKEGKYGLWQFKDDGVNSTATSSSIVSLAATSSTIKINYRSQDFVVKWKYDLESNSYVRYLGGDIYRDKAGKVVMAKNVAIQYARAAETDEKMRLDMTVIGTGKAYVCQDGRCEQGIWKKKTKKDRTRFYQADQEFSFNAGLTWINVVRPYYKVEIN